MLPDKELVEAERHLGVLRSIIITDPGNPQRRKLPLHVEPVLPPEL